MTDVRNRRYREPERDGGPADQEENRRQDGLDDGLGDGREGEILLPAGDVPEGVVRVGGTVRRPAQPQSFAVAGYLDYLEGVGFPDSPRFLGRDQQGRDVLT